MEGEVGSAGSSSYLEQVVELFLDVGRRAGTPAGRADRLRRIKIVAVVCPVFFFYPLGLRLAALIVDGRIKEAAIAATVEVGVTLGAGFPFPHPAHAQPFQGLTALPATDAHG